jgi:hypothetical protein
MQRGRGKTTPENPNRIGRARASAARVEAQLVAAVGGSAPLKFMPRARLNPIGMAIQHALLRKDRDGRTRLEKLGELAVKRALEGDDKFFQMVADRYVGKVMPMDRDGDDKPELQTVLLQTLVDQLVDKKLGGGATLIGSASVADVVERAIKAKE